jgi:predicted nucleic acid-binding Zn ribbon protein
MICEQCGKTFDAKRSTARFCSTKCRVAWNRASKKTVASIKCISCGKTFQPRHGSQIYCSDYCAEFEQLERIRLSKLYNTTIDYNDINNYE